MFSRARSIVSSFVKAALVLGSVTAHTLPADAKDPGAMRNYQGETDPDPFNRAPLWTEEERDAPPPAAPIQLPEALKNRLINRAIQNFDTGRRLIEAGKDGGPYLDNVRMQVEQAGGFPLARFFDHGITRNEVDRLDRRNGETMSISIFLTVKDRLKKGLSVRTQLDELYTALDRAGGFSNPVLRSKGITQHSIGGFLREEAVITALTANTYARNFLKRGQDANDYIITMRQALEIVTDEGRAKLKKSGITEESLDKLWQQSNVFLARQLFHEARVKFNRRVDNSLELMAAEGAIKEAGGFKTVRIDPVDWIGIGGVPLRENGVRIEAPAPFDGDAPLMHEIRFRGAPRAQGVVIPAANGAHSLGKLKQRAPDPRIERLPYIIPVEPFAGKIETPQETRAVRPPEQPRVSASTLHT